MRLWSGWEPRAHISLFDSLVLGTHYSHSNNINIEYTLFIQHHTALVLKNTSCTYDNCHTITPSLPHILSANQLQNLIPNNLEAPPFHISGLLGFLP